MSGLYGIMHTGTNALLTQQQAINVTGHNIANANTEGYSRQRVVMETSYPINASPGQMGSGVQVSEIQRIHDRFVDAQINGETTSQGRWEAQQGALQNLESIFDESSGYGLSSSMNAFWNAWQDLSNRPEGQAERVTLLAKSDLLVSSLRNTVADAKEVQQDINQNIDVTLKDVNLVTAQIADLNERIGRAENVGQNANDYRDKRELLINDLASIIDINTFEGEDSRVTVTTTSGRALVQGTHAWQLDSQPDVNGMNQVAWLDSTGAAVDITSTVSSGQLKGWLEVRDGLIPDYLGRMDTLSQNMITEVNALHTAGFGLIDSGTGLPYTGNDFFTGTGVDDIAINAVVVNDINAIAASQTAAGVPGDSTQAIAIADLQNKLTMGGPPGTETFNEFYGILLTDVGSDVQAAEINANHQTEMSSMLKSYRESVSGVSLDEEMVNLVKFQHAYEAAAKLIGTVDEMLESIIAMV